MEAETFVTAFTRLLKYEACSLVEMKKPANDLRECFFERAAAAAAASAPLQKQPGFYEA